MGGIKFSRKVVMELSDMVSSYTDEKFSMGFVIDDSNRGIRYVSSWNGMMFEGKAPGRVASAFLVGAALGWSSKTAQPMPPQMIRTLKMAQTGYITHRACRDTEAEGVKSGSFAGAIWIKDRPGLLLANQSVSLVAQRSVRTG